MTADSDDPKQYLIEAEGMKRLAFCDEISFCRTRAVSFSQISCLPSGVLKCS
uniref:Uncharacterized protein n=1 Tax=Parascaris equorum TaxID=6256 RepID=A0A914R727_PAREQ